MNTIYLDDIAGTIGEWLDADFDSEVPYEVITLLQRAYKIAVKELEG
jgi:hypothetical protein